MQDLNTNFAIVDANGYPTQYFMRLLQERGIGQSDIEAFFAVIKDKSVISSNHTLSVLNGLLANPGDVDLSLTPTGVTPGPYTNTNLTVDEYGRIVTAANGSGGGGGGVPWWFSPPTLAGLPNVVAGFGGTPISYADDTDAGLLVSQDANRAGLFGRFMPIPVPASDWSLTVKLDFWASNSFYTNRSMIIGNGALGKFAWWGWDNRQTAHYMHYVPTGYDGYEVLLPMSAPMNWFRMDYITATGIVTCSVSGSGKKWTPLTTDNVKAYMGGDPAYAGIGITTEASVVGADFACSHWDHTF